MKHKEHGFLALGSNLGARAQYIHDAIAHIASFASVMAQSSIYQSEAKYLCNQPPFLNAVIKIATDLSPLHLLHKVKEIERTMGRTPGPRFGPRQIDIDILTLGHQLCDTEQLCIPHRAMTERAFVLRPFAEIAPDYIIAGLGQSATSLYAQLPQSEQDSVDVYATPSHVNSLD